MERGYGGERRQAEESLCMGERILMERKRKKVRKDEGEREGRWFRRGRRRGHHEKETRGGRVCVEGGEQGRWLWRGGGLSGGAWGAVN